jgi:hypothetical protein
MPPVEAKWIPTVVEKFGGGSMVLNTSQLKELDATIQKSAYAQNMKALKLTVPRLTGDLSEKTLLDTLRWFLFTTSGKPSHSKLIIGDKTPSNITKLNILTQLDPFSKVIHIVRDPRDQSRSMVCTWGKSSIRNASRWSKGVESAESWGRRHPSQYLLIRYEDLLSNPKEVINSVCTFLTIPFDDKLLSLEKPSENLGDAKGAIEIVSSNTCKWETFFSEKTLNQIEGLTVKVAGPLGYKMKSQPTKLNCIQELWHKTLDGINLLLFYSKEHGVGGGLRYFVKTKKD